MTNINPYFWFSEWNYGDDTKMTSTVVTAESVQEAITAAMETIYIDEDGNLMVDGVSVGEVEAGSVISNVTLNENNELVITYKLETGETKTIETSLAKLVDVYTAGTGINVEDNTISINDDEVATQEELDTVQTQVTDIKETAITSVELSATDGQSYELLVDGEAKGGFTIPSIEGLATTEELTTAKQDLEGEIENCVKEVSLDETDNNVFTLTVDGEAKGGFTLPDTSNLLDKETADETYQPKGSYVSNVSLDTTDNNVYTLTVDGEAKGGFTLPSTEGLATTDEVNAVSANVENNAGQIATLQAMVDVLTAKVGALSQTNTVPVDLSNLTGDLTDATADYVLSGTLSSTVTVTGKSITLDDTVVVSNDNRLNLKANDVTINGSTISGEYIKTNGNSVIKIDECENVVIQNLTFDDTYSGYNGVEISLTQGGTTYPKNILVDSCEIGGTFSNNAINVYATADNATVTISNCHFVDVSNCLRISNTTKATGVTFNVVNCTVDQWEHKEDNEAYYGFFLGQDYTSGSDEEAKENNLFGQDKITLNFTNLIHAGEKVCPSDPYSVCGVDDGTQVVYTYADKHGKWYGETDKEMYPVVTFA
ncbi:MAG: hypothetical protein LUD72_10290 [Bacteroidales bacterium]|nr:hypothetical protein [Bacteroidales bacterium]